jgi:hypothetical protein
MKVKIFIIGIFAIIINIAYAHELAAQNQQNGNENYWNYHDLINKAEISFYLNGNIDSCLYYYNQAFNSFSFNYVHDIVNAAQIACFSKKEYKSFIYEGLHYGLKSSHLKRVPLLKAIVPEIEDFEKTPEYKTIRQNYLTGLDFDYLDWMYELAIEDQIKKIEPDSLYEIYTFFYIKELIQKIKQNGFPSNKTIGIEDATIFSEINEPELDLNRRLEEHHDYFWRKEYAEYYFKIHENSLSHVFIMALLHHRGCSYSELRDILLEEIEKGNLHPREFGFIYDRQCEDSWEIWSPMFINCPNLIIEDGVFRIGTIPHFAIFDEYPKDKVNALRTKYSIVSTEVDDIKKEFENKHGFILTWGFFDCL